jgi:hypothetical protein
VAFTAPANFYLPKYGYITYSWTFDQASNMTTYVSASNQFGYNPQPPSINWTQEGTFTVTVTITTHYANGNIASTYFGTVDINIDATCCQGFLPVITSFTNGQTYTGIHYIAQDITLPAGYSIELTGLLLIQGEATLSVPSTPGGSVAQSTIFAESGSEFIINGGQIRGACKDMWGGIKMEDDAYIEMYEAYISDSYDGIYSDPNNGSPIIYNIDHSEFENNRRCLTAADIDGTLNGRNFLTNNLFHCTTSEFMEPFANTAHNTGENYRMEYAVKLEREIEMDGEHFKNNDFINAIVGVQFRMEYDFSNPILTIESNNFENNQFIGAYSENLTRMEYKEGNSFVIPIDPDIYSIQYWQFRDEEFPHLNNEEAVFGEYALDVRDILNYSSYFDADSYDDPYFDGVTRIGIKAELIGFPIPPSYTLTSLPHFYLNESTFEKLHVGAEIGKKADYTEINENRFTDNQIGLHYTSNTSPGKMVNNDFDCNKFELVNAHGAVQYYGMYINDGTEFYDIADNGINGHPAGNAWPTDGNNDPTITTGTTGNINVTLWTAPGNWYSIYDANTTPGWTYWRYHNEFVGEDDNAVFPVSIVFPASQSSPNGIAPSNQCLAYLNIPFPQMIVLSGLEKDLAANVKVFPNPVASGREIEIKSEQSIMFSEIIDLNGKIKQTLKFEKRNENMIILTEGLESGMYILNLTFENGQVEKVKIVLE